MSTPRLLLAASPALAVLGLGDDRLHWLLPAACLAALLAIGELWLRALTAEAVAAACRIGLVAAAGLVTLPLVAIVLHVLGVPIRAGSLAVALAAVAALLGVVVLLRERSGRVPADPRLARTVAAVVVPLVLALVVGGAATFAYVRLPHPPQPGFTSLALGGWAARIDGPVTIPRQGLQVPIRVHTAGRPSCRGSGCGGPSCRGSGCGGQPAVAPLTIRVGDRAGPPRPFALPAGGTRSAEVHVPAPPNGCLHRIEISLGAASTVFYARGPFDPRAAGAC